MHPSQAGRAPAWFAGIVWESGAIVGLHMADAATTVAALALGAVELNAIASFLLSGGAPAFLGAKLLFAGWVVIGLAWIHREWSPRHARIGAQATVAILALVVAWNTAMLGLLA